MISRRSRHRRDAISSLVPLPALTFIALALISLAFICISLALISLVFICISLTLILPAAKRREVPAPHRGSMIHESRQPQRFPCLRRELTKLVEELRVQPWVYVYVYICMYVRTYVNTWVRTCVRMCVCMSKSYILRLPSSTVWSVMQSSPLSSPNTQGDEAGWSSAGLMLVARWPLSR